MSVLDPPPTPPAPGAAQVPAERAYTGTAPSRRFRRGRLRELSVGQVVVAEVALGGLLASFLAQSPFVLGGTAAVAAAVLVLAFGRTDGRWLYRTLVLRRALAGRRRSAVAGTAAGDPRRAVLATIGPGFGVRTVEDRGQRVGVGADAGGWFVVLEVGAVDGVGVAAAAPVPLAALAGALQDDSAGVSALQLVTHTVPVTGAGLDPRVPCMASNRQLPGDGLGTFPAHRHTWLALRLDTGDAAAAALARGGGLDGVDRTLVASAGRTGTVLAGAGLHHRVLDSAALLDALDSSCGLGLHPGVPVDERWDAVSLAGVLHRTWAVSTWGHTGLLPQLCRAVAAETSVALVLGAPAEGQVTLRAMVRVMAPEAEMGAAAAALEQGAAMVGARLQRLDGEQAAGMYATAPTGGGPL